MEQLLLQQQLQQLQGILPTHLMILDQDCKRDLWLVLYLGRACIQASHFLLHMHFVAIEHLIMTMCNGEQHSLSVFVKTAAAYVTILPAATVITSAVEVLEEWQLGCSRYLQMQRHSV